MAWDSIINPCFSEHRWVDRISNILHKETAIHMDNHPTACVFQIPNALRAEKPEAYNPQLIALGPYHHLHPELYQMERYKLAALKEILKPDQILVFKHLVIDKLKDFELVIRSCYQKYMEFDDETLAWILAIDGLFLLDLLHTHFDSGDSADRRLTQGTILTGDIMMLENQIPLVVLKEIRKSLEYSSSDEEDDVQLCSMLLDFCEAHSPLKLALDSRHQLQHSHVHLLDLMYHLIVKNQSVGENPELGVPIHQEIPKRVGPETGELQREELMRKFDKILDVVDGLDIKGTKKVIQPVKIIRKIPWAKISGLLGKDKETNYKSNGLAEEIQMPSVTHMHRYANIKCCLTAGGIKDIRFDEKELKLYLPALTLNASSEVILRNLVAYEVAISSGSAHELGQYAHLMSGIINKACDVKMLRESGIIRGVLTNNETANLFSSMKWPFMQSDQKSNVELAIEQINRYFGNRLVVKAYRRMKQHVYASWKFLTLVAALLLLLLLGLQSFCDVYSCSRVTRIIS